MKPSHSIIILTMTLLVIGSACEKDEFATAPGTTASAKADSPDNLVVAPATRTNPSGSNKSAGVLPAGSTLPTDHPPVGAGLTDAPPSKDVAPRPRFPVTADKPVNVGKAGPLLWSAPGAWQSAKPSSSMRLAEYIVPAAEGQPPSIMSIFFFGAQGGGGVDANIARWVGQFKQADGSSSEDAAKRSTREVNGMKIHLVDVQGNYDAGAAMMGGAAKSSQRMLGAIVEAPTGLFFFKLLGEAGAVTAQEKNFDAFISSMKPGS